MGLYTALTLTCVLFAGLETLGAAQDAGLGAPPKNVAIRLKQDLFRDYDSYERPVLNWKTTITVKVLLWLTHLAFLEELDSLEVHCGLWLEWQDDFLTWDPSQYDGLDKLRVDIWKIWTPNLYQFTASDMDNVFLASGMCSVESKGNVTCLMPNVYRTLCVPDLTTWPFDRHTCHLAMGLWNHPDDMVNAVLMHDGHALSEYEATRDWELLRINSTRKSDVSYNQTYSYLWYEFVIQRHPGGHSATVVVPAFVLAGLTLLTFWLDPCVPNRLSIICFTLLVECLYLQYLGMKITSNGDTCPVIVLFFRDALLLGTCALVQTTVIRRLKGFEDPPPAWVISPMTMVQGLRQGQFLRFRESPIVQDEEVKQDTTGPENTPSTDSRTTSAVNWMTVALLLDRIFFAVFLLCFFILSVRYVT